MDSLIFNPLILTHEINFTKNFKGNQNEFQWFQKKLVQTDDVVFEET